MIRGILEGVLKGFCLLNLRAGKHFWLSTMLNHVVDVNQWWPRPIFPLSIIRPQWVKGPEFNWLWPSEAIWHHINLVTACQFFGTKPIPESVLTYLIFSWMLGHYLNHCWLIFSNKLHWNLNQILKCSFLKIHIIMLSAICQPFC